jgi:hypothetical protein
MKISNLTWLPLLFVSAAFWGCAGLNSLAPVDVKSVNGPGGVQAAAYGFNNGHGDWDNVFVSVWVRGVMTRANPSRQMLVLDWKIDNKSGDTLILDLNQTHLILPGTVSNALTVAPDPFSGFATIAPRTNRTIELSFRAPDGASAASLDSVRVDWLLTSEKRAYSQTTRFGRREPEAPSLPRTPTQGGGVDMGQVGL